MTKDKLLSIINLMGLPEPCVYNHEDEVFFEWSKAELGKPLGTIVRLILDNGGLQLMISFDDAPAIFAGINLS